MGKWYRPATKHYFYVHLSHKVHNGEMVTVHVTDLLDGRILMAFSPELFGMYVITIQAYNTALHSY